MRLEKEQAYDPFSQPWKKTWYRQEIKSHSAIGIRFYQNFNQMQAPDTNSWFPWHNATSIITWSCIDKRWDCASDVSLSGRQANNKRNLLLDLHGNLKLLSIPIARGSFDPGCGERHVAPRAKNYILEYWLETALFPWRRRRYFPTSLTSSSLWEIMASQDWSWHLKTAYNVNQGQGPIVMKKNQACNTKTIVPMSNKNSESTWWRILKQWINTKKATAVIIIKRRVYVTNLS